MWIQRFVSHGLAVCFLSFLSQAQEQCPASTCTYDGVAIKEAAFTNNVLNYYYIGGLFGVHERGPDAYTCGMVRTRGILNLEAFLWAIDKYSPVPSQVSIGGVGFDSCSREEATLENVLSFEGCKVKLPGKADPRQLMAYVGPDRSTEALGISKLFNDMNRTTVSHAATSPALSDSDEYPYFFRTVPSDLNDATIIAKLLQLKSMKYIQIMYQDDLYGKTALDAFKDYVEENNIDVCIISEMAIPPNPSNDAVDTMIEDMAQNRRDTRTVVLFANSDHARLVLESVNRRNQNGLFQFIGTSSWGDSVDVISGLNGANNAITVALSESISAYAVDVKEFYTYLNDRKPSENTANNKWFTEFWEQTFKCNINGNRYATDCDVVNQDLGSKNLRDVYVPYTLIAVNSIVRGLRSAAEKYCSGQYHFCSDLLNVDSRGQKIRDEILAATSAAGNKFFDSNGDVSATFTVYKILQVKENAYQDIAYYLPALIDQFPLIDAPKDLTLLNSACTIGDTCELCPGEVTTTPKPAAVTTTPKPLGTTPPDITEGGKYKQLLFQTDQEFTGVFVSQDRSMVTEITRFDLGHQWIIALGVLAGMGIVCVLVFEVYILYKLLGTRIGKQWRTMWLGQLLLFGLFLCFLTLFAYIPVPSEATCGITRFGVGISYAICFGVLLVKLMVILTSKSTESLIPGEETSNYLRGIYQFLMFIFIVAVQVVIGVQWLIHVPPDVVKVLSNNGEEVLICNHYTWKAEHGYNNMTLFVRNEFENHLLSLVYIMFLILITTIVSMKAHGIITNHRESIFIGIASGFSIPIWIAWGLVGGLNRDDPFAQEFGDACIAFGLFLTATLIMFAMFLPKVRQLVNMGVEGIYLEDDRDTYYGGSVIMAPPSYKSRPSSVVYVNSSNLYSDPVIVGNGDPVSRLRPSSTYSAPVYVKRPDSLGKSGNVLRVTGDLTGKALVKKPASEIAYPSSYRRTHSETGGTLKRATSSTQLGAL